MYARDKLISAKNSLSHATRATKSANAPQNENLENAK